MRLSNWVRCALVAAVAAASGLFAERAEACSGYENLVPISPAVPVQERCLTCHQGPSGGARNVFGVGWCQTCLAEGVITDCGPDPLGAPASRCGASGTRTAWDVCAGALGFGPQDPDQDGYTNETEFAVAANPGSPDGIDECKLDPCVALAGPCSDSNHLASGDVSCPCPGGYQGDGRKAGTQCTDVDECDQQTDDCTDVNSTCANTPDGSFSCPCDDGFVGSGHTGLGCTDTDPCDPSPCSPLSVCFAQSVGFSCRACPPGFGGNTSTCPTCPPGYTGNGEGAQGCSDVNECNTVNECSANVSCTNSTGGRACSACPAGYDGNGVGLNGCVKNVCAECSPYASCDPQRDPPCLCNLGFTSPGGSNGRVCEDVDECARNLDSCGANSTCQNVLGSYLCACDEGFAAQGDGCVAATCMTWGQDCGDNAICEESTGKPQCVCADGASGTYPACVASKSLMLGGLFGDPGSSPPGSSPPGNSLPGSSPPSSAAFAAQASGCGIAPPSSGLPRWLPVLLLFGLAARRRRARSTPVARAALPQAALPQAARAGAALLCLLALLLPACGDSKENTLAPTGGSGGSGGRPPSSMGGTGGAMDTGEMGGGAGSGDVPSGGAGGAPPGVLMGAVPGTLTCSHSRQCSADRWCNPGSATCELRNTGEHLTFRADIFNILQSNGCPSCHTPGQRGDVDPSGSGANLLFHELQRGYLSLVAGGVNCQGGAKRLCLDDPASSRLIRQVKAGESSSPESIAFTSWTEPQLQTILRWIASGAPRDILCGNFARDTGEACDEGPTPATRCPYGVQSCDLCSTSCQIVASTGPGPSCGDGVVDPAHEKCDPGSQQPLELGPYGNAVCGQDCTFVQP